MARTGRKFEEVIFTFAKTLDVSAEILFDHKVLDRDTNSPRQCDVWINAKFGGHWPISILVSCKDHKRKLHVGDIGAFRDEIRSTGASAGVIYSRSGYTKDALKKALSSGIACCRIYRNEAADIPHNIWFDQFACKPTISLALQTDLTGSKYQCWNDLFDIPIKDNDKPTTILAEISKAYAEGEAWCLQELKNAGTAGNSKFPINWGTELIFADDHSNQIGIKLIGGWKKYRARLEAFLLNGSYCFSNDSFKGEIIGPAIDTQGPNLGEAWVEIVEEDEASLPTLKLTFILSKPDVEKTLREGIGANSLY